jgi:hypothetical protein
MTKRAPVSPKVANGTLSGLAVSVVTWILTTYIPTFHNGLPQNIRDLLPALVGVGGFYVGGYLSKHQATSTEIQRAVDDLRAAEAAVTKKP